jgi:rare lipoprotein A
MLQVGSYSSRENGEHALARLLAAGIANATLSAIASSGQQMWRLRVNAVEAEVDALASRIAALGFGLPQRVKE